MIISVVLREMEPFVKYRTNARASKLHRVSIAKVGHVHRPPYDELGDDGDISVLCKIQIWLSSSMVYLTDDTNDHGI